MTPFIRALAESSGNINVHSVLFCLQGCQLNLLFTNSNVFKMNGLLYFLIKMEREDYCQINLDDVEAPDVGKVYRFFQNPRSTQLKKIKKDTVVGSPVYFPIFLDFT